MLAVEVALSEDAARVVDSEFVRVLEMVLERVVETEDVAGISPSQLDDADEVRGPERLVRAWEYEIEELLSSPSRPGRGEGAADPRVASARKESTADVNFIAKENKA